MFIYLFAAMKMKEVEQQLDWSITASFSEQQDVGRRQPYQSNYQLPAADPDRPGIQADVCRSGASQSFQNHT